MLTVEDAATIMAAVQLGQQLPINTPEAVAMAERLRREIAEFPPGVEVEIPGEWGIEEQPELMQEMRSVKPSSLRSHRRKMLREALVASSGYRLIESAMASIMPGGGDHWKTQPRAKDGKWINSGVNYDKWPPNNSAANSAKKKIKLLEQLVAKGEYDEFAKLQPIIKSKSPNSYQKGLEQAWKNLHETVKQSIGAPPKGAVEVPGTPALAGWSKIGGSLGTEKGGTYIGPDGAKYYVKTPDNPARAHNEVLAFKLYELAGGNVAKSELVQVEGKTGIATKWMADAESLKWTAGDKVAASEDFALHAWLNNWDAVGAGSENPMDNIKLSEGKLKLVDAGGSLDYSGMGGSGKKKFTTSADEWDTLRDPKINKTMAQVFGGMTDQQLFESSKKLHAFTDNDIRSLVDKYSLGSATDKAILGDTLIERRNKIIEKGLALKVKMANAEIASNAQKAAGGSWVDSMISQAVGPKADEAPVIVSSVASKGEPIPPPPASFVAATKTKTLPPPPSVNSATNPSVQKKYNALYEAAKSGNVASLEAIQTNPNSVQNYAKKAHAYKQQLLAALKDGAIANPEHVVPVAAPATDYAAAKATEKAATASAASAEAMLETDSGKVPKALFSQPPAFQGSKAVLNQTHAEKILAFAREGNKAGIESIDVPDATKIGEFKKKILAEMDQIPQKKAAFKKQKAEAEKAAAEAKVASEKAAAEFQAKYGDFQSAVKDLTKETTVKKEVGWWNVTLENIPVPHISGNVLDQPQVHQLFSSGMNQYGKMPSTVQQAIKQFTSSSYHKINKELISSKGKPTSQLAKNAVRAVKEFSTDLPEGMVLTRKYSFNVPAGDGLKPGQVIFSHALQSTATNESTWSGDTQVRITVGKGVKGLPADYFSYNKGESEVIMAPGQRYAVTKVEDATNKYGTKIRLVHVLALPTGGV